jgi:hypothetical protein
MTTTVVRNQDLGIAAVPSRTKLSIADGIGFNEWKEIGDKLFRMVDSSQWWIGDWLNYGERYRRDYTEAMAAIDLKFGALRGYAYVASKVESATRVAQLSWTHHRVVAPLPADQQREWLDEAQAQGWSKRDLEQAIAESRDPKQLQPTLSIRAIGDLYELCERAAQESGVEPAEWAQTGLRWLAENGSPHMRELAAA